MKKSTTVCLYTSIEVEAVTSQTTVTIISNWKTPNFISTHLTYFPNHKFCQGFVQE